MSITPQETLQRTIEHREIFHDEMLHLMRMIMKGELTPVMTASLIAGLRVKKETIGEITAAAQVMREFSTKVHVADKTHLVDIVGTGGDGSGSFNVSTTTSFVVAAAGVPVAKHGNRAVSSHCGAADVIEALGVNLSLPPERVGACVREVGIGFLFAPMMHGAMKYAIGPRREIGIRTLFNILGPMTNPAGANVQLTGVFAPELTTVLAEVLVRLGMQRAIIVWGEGNLDEMTVTGATHIADGHDGQVTTSIITPEQVGLKTAPFATIRGGRTAAAAAEQVRAVLGGEPGPKLDMVLLNAGTTLMAAGLVPDIRTGIDRARETVRSGAALAKLDQLIAFCRA